jgi:hypothetical protein
MEGFPRLIDSRRGRTVGAHQFLRGLVLKGTG